MSPTTPKILVVEDDDTIREVLQMRLAEWDLDVRCACDGAEARSLAASFGPDVVLSDVVLPDLSGIDLLDSLQNGDEKRPVILMTAYGSIDNAVAAMKKGATDFLTKPLDYEQLKATLRAALRHSKHQTHTRKITAELGEGAGMGSIIGQSKPMLDLFEVIRLLAAKNASAILTGESGTGKEITARTIHDMGPRADESFVAINTAAMPEGLIESEIFGHSTGAFTGAVNSRPGAFELAHRGTLFLDEIAEMPLHLQPKFLRVIEDSRVRRLGARKETKVDVRILAATNRDPVDAVKNEALREDLYYRLNVFTIELPPLRDRKDDIPLLSQHFIQQFNSKHATSLSGVGADALELLHGYHWPGNVRELRNVVERALILAKGEWIEVNNLPPFLRSGGADPSDKITMPADVTAEEAEKILILSTLDRVGNNKSEAARRLGVDVKTIRNKLRTYGVQADRK